MLLHLQHCDVRDPYFSRITFGADFESPTVRKICFSSYWYVELKGWEPINLYKEIQKYFSPLFLIWEVRERLLVQCTQDWNSWAKFILFNTCKNNKILWNGRNKRKPEAELLNTVGLYNEFSIYTINYKANFHP